jgi:hypothetical protein
LAGGSPGDNEIADVHARDEQHEPGGAEEDPEGLRRGGDHRLLQRAHRYRPAVVGPRIGLGKAAADPIHLGTGSRQRGPVAKSTDDPEVIAAPATEGVLGEGQEALSQSSWLRTATNERAGSDSSSEKPRPRTGVVPIVSKKPGVTRARLTRSGVSSPVRVAAHVWTAASPSKDALCSFQSR